MTANDMVRM